MSDENYTEDFQEQAYNRVDDLDNRPQAEAKQAAERRSQEARRRIEALQEERQLAKDLADFSYDFDD